MVCLSWAMHWVINNEHLCNLPGSPERAIVYTHDYCHCGHTLRLLLRPVVQLVARFHRLIAREVIGSRTTSRRSPRLVVRPIADRHDWSHDQSLTATTGCTTNGRSPRLVARLIAGIKIGLVLGSEESTLSWCWCHLEDWSPCCVTCIYSNNNSWVLLLAWPLQVEPDGYLQTCTVTCPSAATSASG